MNDMDWYECSEARSFCDGYCVGFYTSANNGAHVESDSDHYKKGFLRGLAAKRIENLGMDVMKQARAQLREEVSRMEGYYGFQGPSQTDEHWEYWQTLQKQVKQIGNESWEAVLLETYRLLNSYSGGAKFSEGEQLSISTIKGGIVRRLAKALAGSDRPDLLVQEK